MTDTDLSDDDQVLGRRPAEPESWADFRPHDQAGDAHPWAWAEEHRPESAAQDLSGLEVVAVLVTLDAADWLPETLDGLARLTFRPTRLIAIDNASTDKTAALLEAALDRGTLDAVYRGRRRYGFGRAVATALAADAEASSSEAGTDGGPGGESAVADKRWLWLLHDDAVPAPDALRELLSHVVGDPTIDISGPKLLLPRRAQAAPQLSEVGVSISGTGRRERMLDPGEVDQGQRDKPQQRLGVSTCGMLVKASVWEDLGGLDPALPLFRDGVELGWRAHLLGKKVVTTPSARFTHRQVSHAGLRPSGAAGRHPAKVDRHLGMMVVAAHAPPGRLPLVWLRLVWSTLLNAVGYLLGKAPARSRDEIAALASFVAHPGRIRAFRRRVDRLEPVPGSAEVLQRLRPPRWSSLRVAAEALSGAVSERYRSIAGDVEASSLDELTGDDFSSVAEEPPKNPWLSPAVIVGILTVIGSLLAARGLFGLGSLTAPALLPAPDRLGEMWQSALAAIPGAPSQISPPWLALAALGSTVLLGQPEWLVTVLLCAVVPLSLIAVYPVVRIFITDRRVRLWTAVSYALLPVVLGGTNQGRLSVSVFAVLLPLLVLAVRALVMRRPRTPEAWRGGWGAGVVLVALVAFEPSMMVFAVTCGLLGGVWLRRTPRKLARIGIALGVPLVVLAPWWPSVVAEPGRLLAGPDSAVGGVPTAPAVWSLLLGRETGGGLPPWWLAAVVFGVIWAAALLGLVRRPARPIVLAAMTTAVLAFATAVLLSRLVVTVPPAGAEARPWTGPYLLIAFAALLLVAGVGTDGLGADMRGRSFSWLQPATVLAGVTAGVVTVMAAGWWVWAGASGPIQRADLTALPPYVRNAMQSEEAARVLAMRLDGSRAHYWVQADDGSRLGDADRGFTFGGSTVAPQEAEDLVLRLVAGTADSDVVPQLRDLGVGFVWVSGASSEQRARIDNTPGLGVASGDEEATVWPLQPPVSRRTLAQDGERTPLVGDPAEVPAGPAGRQIHLGEATDPRWQATIDSADLEPVPAGWQQAFVAPVGGGSLTSELRSASGWLVLVSGLGLAAAAVLAAPGIRRADVRDPTRTARRAASVGSRML